MKHDQHDKVGSTTSHQKDAAADGSLHEQAHKLAASCKGDPKKLAAILESLAPAARDAVIVEAQRMYGNQFVMNAIGAAKQDMGHGKGGGVADGQLGGATGGGSHTQPGHEFGVHGLSSDGAVGDHKVAPMKNWASGLHNDSINTGANNRGTFGDDRLNAGRMTDSSDYRGSQSGNAGMFANTQTVGGSFPDVCVTPGTDGAPAPMAIPYPTVPDGGTVSGPAAPATSSAPSTSTSIPMSKGDNAGVTTGVTSGTAMGSSGSNVGGFTTVVDGMPATRLTSPSAGSTPGTRMAPSLVRVVTLGGTPRDDVDVGGGTPVILPGGSTRTEVKHAGTGNPGGHADGGADPRVESAASGGGIMDRSQLAEGAVHEQGAGTVNWDEVLKINAVVNPGRQ